MKNLFKFLFIFLVLGVVFTSCDDDDDNEGGTPPTITDFELGSGHGGDVNNAKAYVGRDFHMAGKIFAANKIAKIAITIQKEDATTVPTEGWQYTEYSFENDQINADFHEHIIVDKTAQIGKYHFTFEVTDKKGLKAKVERNLEVLKRKKKKIN